MAAPAVGLAAALPPRSNGTSATPSGAAPTTQSQAQTDREREKAKQKKREQEKPINLPDPPAVIVDDQGTSWRRGKLLGSGGFARVYDAQNELGEMKALKVIAKRHLQSRKAKAKILAEIMIHSSLKHPNVVRMEETFEDDEHVYFRLELCKAGSMNDMVKRRGRYLDAEARFFLAQILAGCQGMHTNNIIHRDLKLGNIFLDEKMNVKIGDFGLAALLKEQGERKKTVCGTPNYIAPEVLYDDGDGHSFEVDVWSVGVILYTMLVGKPPFQTSDIQKIYAKIKNNDYSIPPEAGVRPEAEDLITKILAPRPQDRPSLIQIMNHPWFNCGPIPLYIPMQATRQEPVLALPRTWEENERNFEIVKQRSQWIANADDLIDEDDEDYADPREELRQQEQLEQQREKMDRQFQAAIQPASPISALLKASRQPLVKTGAAASSSKAGVQSLSKRVGALSISKAQSSQNLNAAAASDAGSKANSPVTSFAPVDKENARPPKGGAMGPPTAVPALRRAQTNGGAGYAEGGEEERRLLGQKARLVAGMGAAGSNAKLHATAANAPAHYVTSSSEDEQAVNFATPPPQKASQIEKMVHYLGEAIQAGDAGLEYYPLEADGTKVVFKETDPVDPKIFIVSWLDHSAKYGLGYALSDGAVGVHFRDSTGLIINYNRSHIDYISDNRAATSSGRSSGLQRVNYSLEGYVDEMDSRSLKEGDDVTYPAELHPKVKVLRFFEQEIMERLYGAASPLTFNDEETVTGMTFMHKWYRCQYAIVFRFSTGVMQFNFYDHYKLFLSACGLIISLIPPTTSAEEPQTMHSYYLSDLVAISHPERSAFEKQAMMEANLLRKPVEMRVTTPSERKMVRNMLKRLKYCREALLPNIVRPPGQAATTTSHGGPQTLSRQASATTLRTKASDSALSATVASSDRRGSASGAAAPLVNYPTAPRAASTRR